LQAEKRKELKEKGDVGKTSPIRKRKELYNRQDLLAENQRDGNSVKRRFNMRRAFLTAVMIFAISGVSLAQEGTTKTDEKDKAHQHKEHKCKKCKKSEKNCKCDDKKHDEHEHSADEKKE
jgi:hypothetical protein